MIEQTSLGGVSQLNKDSIKAGFYSTPVGRLVGSAQEAGGGDKEETTADVVDRPAPAGGGISEEALGLLKSIDEKLKGVLDALGVNRAKEELALEEAAQEESAAPAVPADPEGGEGGGSGLMKKFGKFAALIGVIIAQVAFPIYQVIKGIIQYIKELGGKIFDFFKDKVIPIFTEDIPQFFTETIPEFFTETLPDLFFSGVDFIKQKFNSVIDGISGFISGIRNTVADLLVSLADSTVAKVLLPDSARDSIKSFAETIRGAKAGEVGGEDQSAAETQRLAAANARAAPPENRFSYDDATGEMIPSDSAQAQAQGAVATPVSRPGATQVNLFAGEPVKDRLTAGQMKEAASLISSGAAVPPEVVNLYNQQAKQGAAAQATPTGAAPAAAVSASSASVPSSGGTGAAVAAGSMAASAPEPMATNQVNAQSAEGKDVKQKSEADPVNPVANVPDVSPNLGNIAKLWYYDAEAFA